MKIRFSKVRVTDHRPRAGATSALEAGRLTRGGSISGKSGLDFLSESQNRERAEHDRAVRDYAPETVAAAWDDLSARDVWDMRDPQHRWIMARKAALRRLGVSMRERGVA